MLITYLICKRKWKNWIIIYYSADFYYFSANTIIWLDEEKFALNLKFLYLISKIIPLRSYSYMIFAQNHNNRALMRWWKIVLFVFHFRFVYDFPDSLNIPEYEFYLLYVAGLWQGNGWNISRKFSINNYSKLCILITYTSK